MKEEVYETNSPEETFALGERFGRAARAGEVYTLNGELGAGKTVFTQGFAKGLGITETVNSPTFTILQVYEDGRLPLYHFDAYRIEDADEADEIGCDEFFGGSGVCIVEWAERIAELLPADRRELVIEKNPEKGFSYRKILQRTDIEGV